MMYPYFRGTMWTILVLITLPCLICNTLCPALHSCWCHFNGAVECVGDAITDIPKQLPAHTYTLQLNVTNMKVINEQSLANQDLLLRFSLTHSHLHTIHPSAFSVAPQLKSVKLSSNDLSTLPAPVFSPLTTLEQLYLDGNQLETVDHMFEGLVGLVALDLSRNNLSSLASDVFDKLNNLTFLNLGKNFIKKLPPMIFHTLTNLRQLFLNDNELEMLEFGVFDELVNLVELIIHRNQITSLAPRVFWSLRNLKTLTLSNNRLQAIPEKSFYNMPKLSKLTIYKNPLLSLTDQLMGHMPDITFFYLYGTNLTTVPGNLFANMSGLQTLNLHLNDKLRELPSELFCCIPKLKKLSLKFNDLHYLHPQLFSGLTTLHMLHLNDNKLESLPNIIFQGLEGVLSVNLKNNHLKTLPEDIFLSNTVLEVLALSGNPWNCSCRIRGVAKWIRHNERVVIDRQDVICHSPAHQMLRTVGSLRNEEFNFCNATRVRSSFFYTHEPIKTFHPVSTSGQTCASTTTLATTVQQVTITPTTPPAKPSAFHTTILTTTLQTLTTTLSNKEIVLISDKPLSYHMSPVFYDTLVVEQGSGFVHHNIHKGWVYVWFLRSYAALRGFLMFGLILLMATGLFLILAAMFCMYCFNETMYDLKAKCSHPPA